MILTRCSPTHLCHLSLPISRPLTFPSRCLYFHLRNFTPLPCPNPSLPNEPSSTKLSRRGFVRHRAFASLPAHVENNVTETFFAEECVSWKSLGVSDKIFDALVNAGLPRPSLIQAASIPRILSGSDVVVASETGSGKTHSYIVPIIDRLLTGLSDEEGRYESEDEAHSSWCSVIFCPNGTLCEQVVRMVNSLCNDNGKPLATVAALGGQQGNWHFKKPNIIVSTPVAFLNMVEASHQNPRRSNFIRRAKYVVFDEADLLLCGSFKNQVISLIDMFRYDEKRQTWMEEENSDSKCREEVENGSSSEGEEAVSGRKMKNGCKTRTAKRVCSWKLLGAHERSKQYIFVAATLPVNGKETAGGILQRMFRDMTWISGNFLHHHIPRLKQEWVEVTPETQMDTLINAVKKFGTSQKSSRIMIFANSVSSAEAVTANLERANIKCLQYHSNIPLFDRSKALMELHKRGGVLVCTDSAARGVDVPNVSHVIQAEFAHSAIDFLHRTGRTARAGNSGLVTSLYNESDKDLVKAVREAAERGMPVESAFSRRRNFRKKLKKAKREAMEQEEESEDDNTCASS